MSNVSPFPVPARSDAPRAARQPDRRLHLSDILKLMVADGLIPAAHSELGNLALRRGRTAEALEHLEQAEKLAPQSSQVHFALANAYRRLGRKDKSSEEMELYQKLSGSAEAEVSPEVASDKAK